MRAEEEIRAVEAARYAAMRTGDVTALAALLDGALIYTHSDGSRDTRASYLEKVSAGHFRYLSIEHPEDAITVWGDAAVVAGRMLAEVTVAGQTRRLANASLAVYRRGKEGWQLVGYQPTPLPRA
ncbi:MULTISPECIES: nuclear transport factor 2 family protein [unclassified Haematobacter]|uniref:nuclear transport factor 2 family protein n=1 Tax=unclassified Haematobacter TaxID=2640585 RepID=UPI0025C0679C|nr:MULTISPECIES: nuclear transport factor 2 family protein [unclassified Haematobacter]